MKAKPWFWPDHVIGKRESRTLREEHNAMFNQHADLLAACQEAELWIYGAHDPDDYVPPILQVLRNAINKAEG